MIAQHIGDLLLPSKTRIVLQRWNSPEGDGVQMMAFTKNNLRDFHGVGMFFQAPKFAPFIGRLEAVIVMFAATAAALEMGETLRRSDPNANPSYNLFVAGSFDNFMDQKPTLRFIEEGEHMPAVFCEDFTERWPSDWRHWHETADKFRNELQLDTSQIKY